MAASSAVVPTKRRPSPRWDQYKRTWYFLRRNTLALVGLVVILLLVALAIYALTIPNSKIPWNSLTQYCATNGPYHLDGCVNVCTYPQGTPPPGPNCYQTPATAPSVVAPTITTSPLSAGPLPLGALTISSGSQYFFNTYQGIVRGSDWSLTIAFSIVIGGAMIGLILGAIAGFWGGLVDEVIMRIVDIFLSIPQILFVIIVVAVVDVDLQSNAAFAGSDVRIAILILAFMVVWWPFYTRIVRGQVLVVREQKYVEAARASGSKQGRIVRKHIIPNSVYPVFIQMSLDVGTVPLLIGALVFLGFRIFPSQYFPEWGSVSALSATDIQEFLNSCIATCIIPWWQLFFPGFVLFMFAISVNFVSDGLRDALDPRLRR